MAILFPRQMPLTGFGAGHQFELQRFDYAAPEDSGRIGGIAGSPAKWIGTWPLSRAMSVEMSDEWRAWVTSLRGQQKLFLGADVARRFPRAYGVGFAGLSRAGGGAFDGAAGSWSQEIDAEGSAVLTLGGLPASFAVKRGDYVGFRWSSGGRRAIVRATEDVTGNSAGSLTVSVEPAVDLRVVPSGATAHFDNPLCLMKLLTDKTELGGMDRLGRIQGGTITGMQVMLP